MHKMIVARLSIEPAVSIFALLMFLAMLDYLNKHKI